MCLCVYVHTHSAAFRHQKRVSDVRVLSYRWLRAALCRCWEPNFGSVQKSSRVLPQSRLPSPHASLLRKTVTLVGQLVGKNAAA